MVGLGLGTKKYGLGYAWSKSLLFECYGLKAPRGSPCMNNRSD